MIHFKIKEEIYRMPLLVIIGTWEDKSNYLEKRYNIEISEQTAFGGFSELLIGNETSINILWLPNFDINNIDDIVTLAHEIDHVAFNVFDLMNIPILDNQSNHAYIYLKEYFLTKALKKLKGAENGN